MTNEFERRFARHLDELEWLFMELDRDALLRFEEMMQTAWKNREEPLRDLDRHAKLTHSGIVAPVCWA